MQAVVPNIDCNVQQAAALNVDLACVPHGLRWKELVAEDHGYYNDPFSINMCLVPLRLQEHSNHSMREEGVCISDSGARLSFDPGGCS